MTREEAINRITDDEKIRKGLIEIFNTALGQDFLQRKDGLDRDKVIAYLEKLEEQKYIYYDQGLIEGMRRSESLYNAEIIVSPPKITNKVSVSEELYEHIRETCACIDDAMSSNSLVDITDYLEMADKSAQAAFDMLEKQKEQPTNEEMLITLRTEYEEGVADTIAKYEQKEQEDEHFELKAGKWYICHHAFCCRADHLTVKEGERFMCEKDGVVKGFIIKEPEKYFIECSAPAPMEDKQKEQKPELPSELDVAAQQIENMKKIYLVFTVNDTKTVNVEVFINKEDAIKRIDDYSDAQVNLENGVSEISDKYSDEFVPQEIYQMFWPVGKILYGTRVKGCLVKGFYKAKISYTTDRFVIEKEVN